MLVRCVAVRIDPLTNPVLLGYLKERGILPEIASNEARWQHSYPKTKIQADGKWYFAVFADPAGNHIGLYTD